MRPQEDKELFTVVAFRYDQKHSVTYATLTTPFLVGKKVELALEALKADVISVRRVYQKRPTQTNKTL